MISHLFRLMDEARVFDKVDKIPIPGDEGLLDSGTPGEIGEFTTGEWDEEGNPHHKTELVEFKPLGSKHFVLIEAKHVNFAS